MKTLLTVIIALLLATAVKSQPAQPGKTNKEERVNNLSRTFSVDKSKAEAIAAALDFNVEAIRATARDTSLSQTDRQAQMKKLHEERQAKIKATLTADQLAVLEAKIVQQRGIQNARMEERRQTLKKQLKEKEARTGEAKVDHKL